MTEMHVTQAGRHCSDAVNLALLLGGERKWVAVRLSDGKSDGAIYDTKADAMKHCPQSLKLLHETQAVYIQVPYDGMTPEDGTGYLAVNRKLYDGGMRLTDPNRTPIMPHTKEEFNLFMRSKP
jgi:hypothetical protein